MSRVAHTMHMLEPIGINIINMIQPMFHFRNTYFFKILLPYKSSPSAIPSLSTFSRQLCLLNFKRLLSVTCLHILLANTFHHRIAKSSTWRSSLLHLAIHFVIFTVFRTDASFMHLSSTIFYFIMCR